MLSREDLDILDRFDTDGGLALSLYLDVSTPERRGSALGRVRDELRTCLLQFPHPDAVAALGEDLEMVDLYLSTTSARHLHYVALFSCARQLFWRAYPLVSLRAESVQVGDRFDTEPLRQAMLSVEETTPVTAWQADLLLQS